VNILHVASVFQPNFQQRSAPNAEPGEGNPERFTSLLGD
jgi:hypothetical protein